jgi:isoaspartyl peptidase/L-asparaginase-like protein (Ntn-hydrolase superfamily)
VRSSFRSGIASVFLVVVLRTLVGSGAHAFASTAHVPVVPPESLIAPRAFGEWHLWKQRLETASGAGDLLGSAPGVLQDTVGAVALDSRGGVAAGVSRCATSACLRVRRVTRRGLCSGGLLLKFSGRIGEVGCMACV